MSIKWNAIWKVESGVCRHISEIGKYFSVGGLYDKSTFIESYHWILNYVSMDHWVASTLTQKSNNVSFPIQQDIKKMKTNVNKISQF